MLQSFTTLLVASSRVAIPRKRPTSNRPCKWGETAEVEKQDSAEVPSASQCRSMSCWEERQTLQAPPGHVSRLSRCGLATTVGSWIYVCWSWIMLDLQ